MAERKADRKEEKRWLSSQPRSMRDEEERRAREKPASQRGLDLHHAVAAMLWLLMGPGSSRPPASAFSGSSSGSAGIVTLHSKKVVVRRWQKKEV